MSNDYRILVAIDLQQGTERLLMEAERYGRAFDAIVDIVHVGEPEPDFVGFIKAEPGQEQNLIDPPRDSAAHKLRAEHHQTQALGDSLRATGVRVDQILTVRGPVLSKLIEQAQKLKSDLVILGSHHHGLLFRLWYGDVAKDAVGQMPCALLVVPVQTGIGGERNPV